jgi:hypothetical protein
MVRAGDCAGAGRPHDAYRLQSLSAARTGMVVIEIIGGCALGGVGVARLCSRPASGSMVAPRIEPVPRDFLGGMASPPVLYE